MKVILIKDVARIGRKSEIKEVPSGHAQNFLIPRKLAIPATPENMARLKVVLDGASHEAETRKEAFLKTVAGLKETTVVFEASANDQGHLFKGVHASDIATSISALGFQIEEADIVLPQALKTVGVHPVTLTRGEDTGVCTFEIKAK